MRTLFLLAMLTPVLTACAISNNKSSINHSENYKEMIGFMDMSWNSVKGRLLLHINDFNQPFLYQSSLARGIGSNDLGLDRGQLGSTKIVEFQRSGPKVLLLEHNLDYRALSNDSDEKRAVEQSFAQSVIWGFDVVEEKSGAIIIDATEFFLRDAHAISTTLSNQEEGTFKPERSRSAMCALSHWTQFTDLIFGSVNSLKWAINGGRITAMQNFVSHRCVTTRNFLSN